MKINRGSCLGVFILCYTARILERKSINEWLTAARTLSTFMTEALDIALIANRLVHLDLATINGRVSLSSSLQALSDRADKSTLIGIAKVLLLRSPPFWLHLAVNNERILKEYIPQDDLENLSWIGDELDQVLLDVYLRTFAAADDGLAHKIGETAELIIFEGLKYNNFSPFHVAQISDAYGYDIEYFEKNINRLEIKAASQNTQYSFHLSRNEFEKSKLYFGEWRLIQLVFSNESFISENINNNNVIKIIELKTKTLHDLIPPDTDNFEWERSAVIRTNPSMWEPWPIQLNPDFTIKGFKYRK